MSEAEQKFEERLGKKKLLLGSYVKMLKQHFDTVRVFVTVHDVGEERTYSLDEGRGNFEAQAGQVRGWLVSQEARAARHGWDDTYESKGAAGNGGDEGEAA